MIRKLASAALLILLSVLLATAQGVEERKFEIGAWSATINGLRGRLLAAPGEVFERTRMIDVYLELKNVSDVGNPLEIYFDEFDSLKSTVIDADGKALKEPPNAASIASPGPFWLSIPWDGTLRFRVSVSGYGIYKNSGVDIPMSSGNWVIAASDKKEYFLAVDFHAARTTDKRRAWEGTLHLPKVLIPH